MAFCIELAKDLKRIKILRESVSKLHFADVIVVAAEYEQGLRKLLLNMDNILGENYLLPVFITGVILPLREDVRMDAHCNDVTQGTLPLPIRKQL